MIWIIIFGVIITAIVLSIIFELDEFGAISTVGFVIFGAIFVIGIFFSTLNHANDLESVQYHNERVEIQLERLDRLKETLQQFDYPEGALMNQDSPVASIVNQISDTEIAIAESKEAVVETEKDIRSRKRWAFGFATWFVE